MVVALIALFLAMGGTAIAAHHYLITSTKQIKPSVLRKLQGAGPRGKEGAAGKEGPAGKEGKEGKEGPRGPGIVAAASSGGEECELKAESNIYCYGSMKSFSPSVEAKCEVTVFSQIELENEHPTGQGPFFRIAIKEGGTNTRDNVHGFYFESTPGTESTEMSRTRYITVKPGVTYTFGAYYGSTEGEWVNRLAEWQLTYTCFG